MEDSNLLYNNRNKRKSTLHEQLHIWVTKYNITKKSLTALLCILREEGHDLPSDARTLLEIPKNTIIQEWRWPLLLLWSGKGITGKIEIL